MDLTRLIHLAGIGKKTAERLIVELRDRITDCGVPASQHEMAATLPSNDEAHALEYANYFRTRRVRQTRPS